MSWTYFFTIVAQVIIAAFIVFVLAAVSSVVYNNFKDHK